MKAKKKSLRSKLKPRSKSLTKSQQKAIITSKESDSDEIESPKQQADNGLNFTFFGNLPATVSTKQMHVEYFERLFFGFIVLNPF